MIEPEQGDTFKPGDVLNNTYRIETVLGRGGLSEVYRARSEISGRVVAIKVLKREFSGNEDYLSLMTREEEIRDIRHEAVVRYSENHRLSNGQVYLVMDYVDGPDLEAKLKGGGMSAEDLLQVARQVASGLAACHNRNIVHRDLSPDNIILRNGEPSEAVIIDFGIAKDANPGAGTIIGNEFAGKYSYAAPEQLDGKSDRRSDIYSLGALLLAVFRGQAPRVGNNPMEVVTRKAQPLDTTGVPEPLKSIIDKMTAPDPSARFQTVEEVLAAIDSGDEVAPVMTPAANSAPVPDIGPGVGPGAPDPLDELAPPPPEKPKEEPFVQKSSKKKRKAERKSTTEKNGSGGGKALIAILVLLLIAGGGAGAYFAGLIGPFYPKADPFTFSAEVAEDGSAFAEGYVPSEETKANIENQMDVLRGSAALELATGDISETWGQGITQLVEKLMPLEEWRLVASGNQVQITGLTLDRQTRDRLNGELGGILPGGLTGGGEILLGPRILAPTELRPVITEIEDCGPLRLIDPPPLGYGLGATITIAGKFASPATRSELSNALAPIIGDRSVSLMVDTLNPALCLAEGRLPSVPPNGLSFILSDGDGTENFDGVYRPGDSTNIDIVIPGDITEGHIWVALLDVKGQAYHILPNRLRPNGSVTDLRSGQEGPIRLRVAHAEDDPNRTDGQIAKFDDTLGQSMLVVMHTNEPLFPMLRGGVEAVDVFMDALDERLANPELQIDAMAKRVITTVR